MGWLSEAWRFIESEENREVVTFIGGGIAVAVAAAWQVYKHFAQSNSTEQPSPTVTASGGGVATGGDLRITQTGPGTLIVGGVGISPEAFRSSVPVTARHW